MSSVFAAVLISNEGPLTSLLLEFSEDLQGPENPYLMLTNTLSSFFTLSTELFLVQVMGMYDLFPTVNVFGHLKARN